MKMNKNTIKILVDSCRPETRQELTRLFKEGWQLKNIEVRGSLGHYTKNAGCDTYYYILTKEAG